LARQPANRVSTRRRSYPRYNRGGSIYALDVIDGAPIKPLIGEDGRAPVGDDAIDPLEQAKTLQILVGAGIKTRE
jgi:hypothetical protein